MPPWTLVAITSVTDIVCIELWTELPCALRSAPQLLGRSFSCFPFPALAAPMSIFSDKCHSVERIQAKSAKACDSKSFFEIAITPAHWNQRKELTPPLCFERVDCPEYSVSFLLPTQAPFIFDKNELVLLGSPRPSCWQRRRALPDANISDICGMPTFRQSRETQPQVLFSRLRPGSLIHTMSRVSSYEWAMNTNLSPSKLRNTWRVNCPCLLLTFPLWLSQHRCNSAVCSCIVWLFLTIFIWDEVDHDLTIHVHCLRHLLAVCPSRRFHTGDSSWFQNPPTLTFSRHMLCKLLISGTSKYLSKLVGCTPFIPTLS